MPRRPEAVVAAVAALALAALLPAATAQQQQQQAPSGLPTTVSPAAQATSQLEGALRMMQLDEAPADPAAAAAAAAAAAGALATFPTDSTGTAAVTLRDVQLGGLCQTGSPQVPVVELTIAGAQAAMLAGLLNCSRLVEAYLQRIAAYDQRTQLNAIRAVNPSVAQVSTAFRLCPTALYCMSAMGAVCYAGSNEGSHALMLCLAFWLSARLPSPLALLCCRKQPSWTLSWPPSEAMAVPCRLSSACPCWSKTTMMPSAWPPQQVVHHASGLRQAWNDFEL